jgi:hypothetical protein
MKRSLEIFNYLCDPFHQIFAFQEQMLELLPPSLSVMIQE